MQRNFPELLIHVFATSLNPTKKLCKNFEHVMGTSKDHIQKKISNMKVYSRSENLQVPITQNRIKIKKENKSEISKCHGQEMCKRQKMWV